MSAETVISSEVRIATLVVSLLLHPDEEQARVGRELLQALQQFGFLDDSLLIWQFNQRLTQEQAATGTFFE